MLLDYYVQDWVSEKYPYTTITHSDIGYFCDIVEDDAELIIPYRYIAEAIVERVRIGKTTADETAESAVNTVKGWCDVRSAYDRRFSN